MSFSFDSAVLFAKQFRTPFTVKRGKLFALYFNLLNYHLQQFLFSLMTILFIEQMGAPLASKPFVKYNIIIRNETYVDECRSVELYA